MQFTLFMGVDVSKETLDIAIRNESGIVSSEIIANRTKNINQYLKSVFRKYNLKKEEVLICLEHTGIYSLLLLSCAGDLGYATWVEDAVQIKQVLKVNRAKNDKLDAKQIAEYAFRFKDRAVLSKPERTQVRILRKLIGQRRRLLCIRKMLTLPLNEDKKFEDKIITQLQGQLAKVAFFRVFVLILGRFLLLSYPCLIPASLP